MGSSITVTFYNNTSHDFEIAYCEHVDEFDRSITGTCKSGERTKIYLMARPKICILRSKVTQGMFPVFNCMRDNLFNPCFGYRHKTCKNYCCFTMMDDPRSALSVVNKLKKSVTIADDTSQSDIIIHPLSSGVVGGTNKIYLPNGHVAVYKSLLDGKHKFGDIMLILETIKLKTVVVTLLTISYV